MPQMSQVLRERAIGMLTVLENLAERSTSITKRRPRVTTPAQDPLIRLLHMRDCLRPATRTAPREAHLRARHPHQGLDLIAVQRRNRLQWAVVNVVNRVPHGGGGVMVWAGISN